MDQNSVPQCSVGPPFYVHEQRRPVNTATRSGEWTYACLVFRARYKAVWVAAHRYMAVSLECLAQLRRVSIHTTIACRSELGGVAQTSVKSAGFTSRLEIGHSRYVCGGFCVCQSVSQPSSLPGIYRVSTFLRPQSLTSHVSSSSLLTNCCKAQWSLYVPPV